MRVRLRIRVSVRVVAGCYLEVRLRVRLLVHGGLGLGCLFLLAQLHGQERIDLGTPCSLPLLPNIVPENTLDVQPARLELRELGREFGHFAVGVVWWRSA